MTTKTTTTVNLFGRKTTSATNATKAMLLRTQDSDSDTSTFDTMTKHQRHSRQHRDNNDDTIRAKNYPPSPLTLNSSFPLDREDEPTRVQTLPGSTATDTYTSDNDSNSNNQQDRTTEDKESLWKDLWQKCVGDCYCLSGNHTSTNTNEEPKTVEFDYFQYLPQCQSDNEDLAELVPQLCQQIQQDSPKIKLNALRELQHLCDRQRANNRIELVCGGDYNIVPILCQHVILNPSVNSAQYRQALLILSNLTLPMENKAVLLLDLNQRDTLLNALLQALKLNTNPQVLEIHLVCAILYNLSFHKDGKTFLCQYGGGLDNKQSLLHTIQHLALQFQPFVAPQGSVASQPAPIALSVERQALRWILGFTRNLAEDLQNAKLIGVTQIPTIALNCIAYSLKCDPNASTNKWKQQSLEDLALSLLVELALREEQQDPLLRCAVVAPQLHQSNCRTLLKPLLSKHAKGIHAVRAKAIVQRFDPISGNEDNAATTKELRDDQDCTAWADAKVGEPKRRPYIASV